MAQIDDFFAAFRRFHWRSSEKSRIVAGITAQWRRKNKTSAYLPFMQMPHSGHITSCSLGQSFATRRATLLASLALVVAIAGCGDQDKPPLDQQIMTATTSPIPGAHATVFPSTNGPINGGPQVDYCVTSAGYCPLPAPSDAGRNCLCEAGAYSYGGATAAAPETYKAP